MKHVLLSLVMMAGSIPGALAEELKDEQELETVPYVDLERYTGTWFEVASIPQVFQRGCLSSVAQYSFRDDGDIRVLNSCQTADGIRKIEGKAWAVDPVSNAKLKVQFFWPFSGNYWIIELDEDYRYAVVGEPERESLWILSRTPRISEGLYQDLLERIEYLHGYDTDKIVPAGARSLSQASGGR